MKKTQDGTTPYLTKEMEAKPEVFEVTVISYSLRDTLCEVLIYKVEVQYVQQC